LAKTVLDLDLDLVAEVAQILGTKTKRATVDAALREVASRRARQRLAYLIAQSGESPAELDRIGRGEAWR
jgi:Arc/MetJ family transcription regulator